MLHDLMTPQGEALTGTPWNVHPRPQLRRERWLCLNGHWDFGVGSGDFDRKILVPFCPESQLSGIAQHFPEGIALNYRKKLTLPEDYRRGRVLMHIGAADQRLNCSVNGRKFPQHIGGYTNITYDITDALQEGENELLLTCFDDLKDQSFPYGKQTLTRGGMWYTPTSGIWQSVWLEAVPETYVKHLRIENRGDTVIIDCGLDLPGTVTVKTLGTFPLEGGKVSIAPEHPHCWSPEDPYLYDFTLEVGEDRVESYFAIRSLEVKKIGKYQRLLLNGKPYFFHGLLDQGYWSDGLLTPASPESYIYDIQTMKKLGFNMLRKPIKVEMEEFYYQCDRLGMIVFQDMENNSDYRFFRDTALPTARIQVIPDKWLHRNQEHRRMFLDTAENIVKQLKNHPCICCWTIFNEGWGQFDADAVYSIFRSFDDTRFIDSTSGWFRRRKTDVDSRHVYFRKVKLKGGRKPLVLSEFGGKTHRVEGHVFNPDKVYGYGGCETSQALEDALVAMYREEILPCIKNGLCAAVYTQVSDVEDEINGLLTYDRKAEKVRPEKLLPLAAEMQAAVEND